MRYAKRHLRVARILASRAEGVTAQELAGRAHISERLAKKVLDDLVGETEFRFKERLVPNHGKRLGGPRPVAAVVA